MDAIEKKLLEEVADLHGIPEGAYNIRADGKLAGRNTTAHINIVTKEDKPGIDIYIAPGTKNESVHIPVIISQTGLKDMVYNDFYIGEDCDVTIVAGCGIHNCGTQESRHDGIHSFFVGKNARVRYIEKHYGEGDGNGENVMNPNAEVDDRRPRRERLHGDGDDPDQGHRLHIPRHAGPPGGRRHAHHQGKDHDARPSARGDELLR